MSEFNEYDKQLSESLRSKYSDGSGSIDSEKLDADIKKTQSFTFRLHLFMSAVFILAGLAFVFVGSLQMYSAHKDKKVCTVRTDGVVSDFDSTHSDPSDPSSSLVYAPVFTYTFEGREYTYHGQSYSDKGSLFVGKKVSVYVDTDDPMTIYVPDYKVERKNAILFIIVGLALSGGFIGYCFYKRYRIRKDYEELINYDKL
ncbi:MAG: DUF3592 domain-containing protein [Ruminococcus sp.]|nr:DUF3592 domain-containing protein [Ruminococcus sp.]